MSKNAIKMAVPIIVLLVLWFFPAPEGLRADGWHFLAIFLAVVIGLIIEPVPAALVGLIGVSLVALFGLAGESPGDNIKWLLSGFSNSVIWLIFAAFMFAMGYQKTGLGKRVSLIMVKYTGKSTLGLGYSVAFADLLLAPFMPSNTARSAGTIYPIASNIPIIFGSTPEQEPRKLGAYLSWVAIAATCVTSSMFLTALAPNLLAVDLINKGAGVTISWGSWAMVMIPLMLPVLLLVPLIAYVVYPPTQKNSPEAPQWAKVELEKMGKFSRQELLMALFALTALILWIFGDNFGIHSTTAAIAIVSVMVLTKVISWEDVIGNKAAWNVLIWFATLVSLASGLNAVGVLTWVGNMAETSMSGLSPLMLMLAMLIAFFLLHYFFASVTAHTTALLPLFVVIAMKLIAPEQIPGFMILLAGSLGIMGIITPYATGPSPIWYGAGYITQAKWWGLGAIFGAIYLVVLLAGVFIFVG